MLCADFKIADLYKPTHTNTHNNPPTHTLNVHKGAHFGSLKIPGIAGQLPWQDSETFIEGLIFIVKISYE